jgi:hypothetical protein
MTTPIKYTATLDDNPFAAGAQRLGTVLQGIQQRFSQVGRDFTTVGQGMSAQMGHITDSVRGEVAAMGGHFSSLLEAVGRTRLGFVALVGAAAGLAAGKAVAATAEMTEAAMDLGRVLGTSTNEAQKWRIALQDVGAQESDLEGAAKGMARQLKENEANMNAMGLVTRDAAGNLRPMNELLVDGLAVLNQHKEGADRALASQQLFGRGVDASSKLLLINKDTLEDATKTMEDLGLEVGANAVAAWKEYDAATDRAGFSMRGLGNTVGRIVMPILTDLINVFNAVMPAAITVTKGALGGLATAFHVLKNGVIVVWEVINAFVISVAEPIRALAEAMARAMTGDLKGAAAAIGGIGTTIAGAWSNAMDRIAESSQRTRDRVAAIWNPDSAPGEPEGERGTKTYTPPPDTKTSKTAKKAHEHDPSFMKYYELALSEEKRLATERDALRDYTKQQELQFWRELMANAELTGQDRVAVARKISELTVQVKREEATKLRQLDDISREQKLAAGLYGIELARMEAGARYELGQISATQLLEQERQLEEKRAEIRREALLAKQATIDPERDPVAYAQVASQIEEEERQHQLRLAQIRGEVQKAQTAPMANIWAGVEQSFQQAANGILNRTQTLRQGLTTLWQGIRASITGEISKIIAQRVAAFAKERVLALAGIGADAAKAGSGAAASQASIPYVGPILAVAAMAAIFAGVMGMSSKVPSAAGGFNIPRGMNPLTQLHEEEMVLPADIANPLRSAIDGGGVGRGGDVHLQVKGTGVGDFLLMHRSELVRALKEARRDFQF